MRGSKGAEEQRSGGARATSQGCPSRGYEDAATYGSGKGLAVEGPEMTLKNLPRFELCNEGSWVRLSSQFVSANFVDDCGMKRHKAALARYSTHSLASRGETKAHLELRRETDFVASSRFEYFYKLYRKLGAMLYNFRKAAIEGWVPAALQGVSGSLRLCGPVALRLC